MAKMKNINQAEFFHQAVMRICGSLDINAVLSDCLSFFKSYIPINGIFVGTIIGQTNQAIIIASKIEDVIKLRMPEGPIEIDRASWRYIKQHYDEPVTMIGDMANNPASKEYFKNIENQTLSGLVLKLKDQDSLVGVVHVIANGLNRFNRHHADLFTLLQGPFTVALSNSLKHRELKRLKDQLADDNTYLNNEIRQMVGDRVIGRESGLREVMEMVGQVAPLSSQVLILGETGVGKEVIANAIHNSSSRASGPFIKVNCGAIPDSLMDSELFGHEPGAFTGATAKKRGRFERADKGTIFLDEIGELPPQAQVRLLRVIQNKEIERVGGSRLIPLDIRIVAATHRNLEALVKKGEFREDLWYRLNVFPIVIPPLRHRRMDIPAMVNYFIKKKSSEMNLRSFPSLSAKKIKQLQNHHWPGNVRELENAVERALIRNACSNSKNWEGLDSQVNTDRGEFLRDDLPDGGRNLNLDDAMRKHIRFVLKLTNGRIYGDKGAAAALGVNPSTLRNRMDKLDIAYKKKKRRAL